MGMVSITFSVYTTPDGRLAMDAYIATLFPFNRILTPNRHDQIAELMGIPGKTFIATYKDEVQQMKHMALEYVKYLKTVMTSATQVGIDGQPIPTTGFKLAVTEDGFPIVPVPWDPTAYSKQQLEELFSEYMTTQYSKLQ